MAKERKIELGMRSALDEMFMDDEGRKDNRLPKIYDISLSEIDDFPDHPFKVRLDEDMDQLVESIKERGLITPIMLRQKEDGRYEVVSGHRRRKACEIAGLDTVRAEIKELTRDEAIILMVDSNLQRSVILPSEKAFSYKMRLEAMKRLPGRPSKENGDPAGHHFCGEKSVQIMANESPDSKTQIQRYIRLTNLIPELLDLADEGKIALRPAVELSYLTTGEQEDIIECIGYDDCTPSHAQAIKMKKFSAEGKLTPEVIESIMSEQKPNQVEKISFKYDNLRRYIPSSVPYSDTEQYVIQALEHYQKFKEKQKQQVR